MINRQIWKYCPKCSQQSLVFADKRFTCDLCGFEFYFNVAAAVAAIIEHDEKIILVRRAKDPGKGMLDLPGGFVDYHETAEHALIREIREELNLELTDLNYLTTEPNRYLYQQIDYPVLDLFFVCKAKSFDQIKSLDDIDDYLWIRPADIQIDQFCFPSTRAGITCYLKNKWFSSKKVGNFFKVLLAKPWNLTL